MFKSIALTLLICCAAVTASAQIGMDLSLNRTNYMQYEPIYACVTLRNDTARPLLFGKHPKLQGYILFEVTDQRGNIVPKPTPSIKAMEKNNTRHAEASQRITSTHPDSRKKLSITI